MGAHTFEFNRADRSELEDLTKKWAETLTAPQDDMWESFRNTAVHWKIGLEHQPIGYACVDDENKLLNFYLLPEWLHLGSESLSQFIATSGIGIALAGTNNPVFLSIATDIQKSIKPHTYLFYDALIIDKKTIEATLRIIKQEELQKAIEFYHHNMGGPQEWLKGYLGTRINLAELYFLENNSGDILGACEIRSSISTKDVANLGMVVAEAHRRKGIGTYLLIKARELAAKSGKSSICSCEVGNIGSYRAITSSGFRSIHRLLEVAL